MSILNLNTDGSQRLTWQQRRSAQLPQGGGEYADKILALNPIAYWPLWEASGATITDIGGSSLDGTYTNVTLGQTGIGDGRTSALFDGATSLADVASAGLATAFNGLAGTAFIWAKAFNLGMWTDGSNRKPFLHQANFNNRLEIRKNDPSALWWNYAANGTQELVIVGGQASVVWFTLALTWDQSADEVRAYYDGVQQGATQTGLGVWAGAVNNDKIGTTSGGGDVWHGWLAHHALWDTALTPAQILELSTV